MAFKVICNDEYYQNMFTDESEAGFPTLKSVKGKALLKITRYSHNIKNKEYSSIKARRPERSNSNSICEIQN